MTIEKKSDAVAKNAAELGGNRRKTDPKEVTVIHGNLVLEKAMTFDNSIRVEGDIVGKDGKRYDLKVNGSLDISGCLCVRHLYVEGDTNAQGEIRTDGINALGNINARAVDVDGNLNAVKVHTSENVYVYGDINAGDIDVKGNIDIHGSIYGRGRISAINIDTFGLGSIFAEGDIEVRDIDTIDLITHGNVTAREITAWNVKNDGTLNVKRMFKSGPTIHLLGG